MDDTGLSVIRRFTAQQNSAGAGQTVVPIDFRLIRDALVQLSRNCLQTFSIGHDHPRCGLPVFRRHDQPMISTRGSSYLSSDLAKSTHAGAATRTPMHAAANRVFRLTLVSKGCYAVSGWIITLYIDGRMPVVTGNDDTGPFARLSLILLGIPTCSAICPRFVQEVLRPTQFYEHSIS